MTLTLIVLFFATLFSLWWLYFFGYRPLVFDQTRQRLFSVRDQLFNEASKHPGAFETEGYRLVRQVINGSIRYAHDATPLRMIIFYMRGKHRPGCQEAKQFINKLQQARDDVGNEEMQKALDVALLQMHVCILFNVINSSLVIRTLVFLAVQIARISGRERGYQETVKDLQQRNRRTQRTIALLDSEVLQASEDPFYNNWATMS